LDAGSACGDAYLGRELKFCREKFISFHFS